MRKNIKDSWLSTHKGNDKRLYRKYRTFYRKIQNINKLFYTHSICNIPMHQETKDISIERVKSYCLEMDKLYYVMMTGEMPPEKIKSYHYMIDWLPFGRWEKSFFIGSFYIPSIKELPKLKATYVLEEVKKGRDNSIFNKIKNFFNN